MKGAALMFDSILDANALIGDKGYDADWFRQALKARGAFTLVTTVVPTPSFQSSQSQRSSFSGSINES